MGRQKACLLFQFHFGAICRLMQKAKALPEIRFNSTLVRFVETNLIRSWYREHCFNSTLVRFVVYALRAYRVTAISFNSTLVRFVERAHAERTVITQSFQFHFGAICSPEQYAKAEAPIRFNSTLVRFVV